jgi:bacterioferritin-associated ferredoxin
MYVCVCHAVTDRDIRCAVAEGCCSLRQLQEQLGVGRTCGRCTRCARETVKDSLQPSFPQTNMSMQAMAA